MSVSVARSLEERYAVRLSATLVGVAILLVALGGALSLETAPRLESAAARQALLSTIVSMTLFAVVSLAVVGVTVGANTAIALRGITGLA